MRQHAAALYTEPPYAFTKRMIPSPPRFPLMQRVILWLRPGTLDRYLLAQLMPPFLVALSVVMSALLLERLLVLFNLLTTGNSHLVTFIGLLATLLPHYLGQALPAALCVSVFSIIRRMSQNEEIDVVNSSGRSLLRMIRPYLQLGAFLGALSFLLYGFIQPHARYDFRSAFYFASHAGWTPRMQSRLFASPSPAMTFTADKVTQSGSELYHVFIRDIKDGEEHDITARRGHIRIADDGNAVEIELEDGMILTTNADDPPTVALFDHSTRYLAHAAQVVPFRQRGEDERELTSPELVARLVTNDTTTISRLHLLSELHFRLARCLTVPFIPLLATALAITRKRQRDVIGLPAAFIIMVGFDHLMQMAHSMAATGSASVLSIWLAAFVFMALCVVPLLYRSGVFSLLRAKLENRLHTRQTPTGNA